MAAGHLVHLHAPGRNVSPAQAGIAAIQAGNCAEFARLNVNQTLSAYSCDERQRRALEGYRMLGYRQFGTGAIIDVAARDIERFQPLVSTVELMLGPDRRFRAVGAVGFGAVGSPGIVQVGTRPAPRMVELANRTARLALVSLRTRNCNLFFQTWFTGELTKPQACFRALRAPTTPSNRNSSIRRLRFQLAGDPLARPVRLGGTRDIQFYRLFLRTGHLYTMIVDRGGTPGDLYLTSTRHIY